MIDIHHYEKKLKRSFEQLENSAVSGENKTKINNFVRFMMNKGVSKPRLIKYLCYLRIIALELAKDFLSVTKEDIERVVSDITQKSYSPWTIQAYKVIIKRFFQWLYNYQNNKYPEIVDWITTGFPKNQLPRRTPHEFPTPDDIVTMIEKADKTRDKALIASVGESGCRIGEIGNLSIRHVSFDDDGAVFYVNGKTGFRPVRIVYASYYLKKWLKEHPDKENPDAPLWVTINGEEKKHISHQRLYEILKNAAKKAYLTKKVNPHNFRHGRGTFLAHFLNGYQLCNYMGWVPGSKMASVYIHMSGKDTDGAILQLHGLQSKNNLLENKLRVQRCMCGELVPITENCQCKKE